VETRTIPRVETHNNSNNSNLKVVVDSLGGINQIITIIIAQGVEVKEVFLAAKSEFL